MRDQSLGVRRLGTRLRKLGLAGKEQTLQRLNVVWQCLGGDAMDEEEQIRRHPRPTFFGLITLPHPVARSVVDGANRWPPEDSRAALA